MGVLKVLVVDDEPGIRSGICRIIKNFTVSFPFMDEDFTFEVVEAQSGEEALEHIEKKGCDILLLDNKLPGIDGIEVLEHINAMQKNIQVMMITSYASLDLAVKATQNGAYNFVPKPFTPQELKTAIESISKHLFLRRMTQQLNEESRKTKFQFLSVLSHELKSPINAVEGYLKIMQEKQLGDNMDDYLQMIDRSIERLKAMRGLINDLLDLTKIESGTKVRNIKTIDLAEMATKAIEHVEAYAMQRKVRFFRDFAPEVFIRADQDEIEIILNNLLSNAIKYNKENGEVHLRIRQTEGKIVLVVEDTGIGMTREESAQLFRDFVRIKNPKTKNITGSGLGLSIVKKLVNEYGGTISVDSEPDRGTKFTIEIPVK